MRNWRELNVTPIDPDHADPYTRCRIITMNGIEVEALLFSHQFARHCPDMDAKRKLAEVRYLEHQQQKAVNRLLPGVCSALETTIAYEQVAVDLTAWVARMEPDPYLKQAYEFGVGTRTTTCVSRTTATPPTRSPSCTRSRSCPPSSRP